MRYRFDVQAQRPEGTESIPVFRPLLPTVDRLIPYFRRIDESRMYSNFGPLVLEFEQRLANLLQHPAEGIVSAGSGSSGLIGAIIGAAGRAQPDRPFALIPAYTFVGTAAAVEACGYRPYLADIAPDTWVLDPDEVMYHPDLESIGLVVPVSTFGRGIEVAHWERFAERTKIPVVIDGAASFDRLCDHPSKYLGQVPVVVSFHATKSFSTGEGGCVISTDTDLIQSAATALNFGFSGSRDSRSASTNGKMSEYHAAVGLAEMDSWREKSESASRVVSDYARCLRDLNLIGRFYSAPAIGGCYALFLCADEEETGEVCNALNSERIDFRLWYGTGLQNQSYYRNCPRRSLTTTESISPRLVGLPFAPDLPLGSIRRVAAALAEGVRFSGRYTSSCGARGTCPIETTPSRD